MRVKAAVVRAEAAPLAIEDLDLSEPGQDEILVRVVAAGVSDADRIAVAGHASVPLPFVPGIEAAGIVEGVGVGVADFAVGDAVVVGLAAFAPAANGSAGMRFANPHVVADGNAPFADDLSPVHGLSDGQATFATRIVCRADRALKVPDETPLELAAALCGELLAAASAVRQALAVSRGDTLVVAGADAVGLFACMVAVAMGVGTLVITDPDEGRRHRALEVVAAAIVVPDESGLSDVVRSLAADGADCLLIADPRVSSAACLDCLKPSGVWTRLVGDPTAQTSAPARGYVDIDARFEPRALARDLIGLLNDGTLPVDRLIAFFPFEHVNDAFAALDRDEVVKGVLRFSIGAFGELDRAKIEAAASEAPDDTPEPVDAPPKVDIPPDVETPAVAS